MISVSPSITSSQCYDEVSAAGHRAQDAFGCGPYLRHVLIERFTVVAILGRKGRHLDRLGVTHLIEQRLQVGVLDKSQCHPRPPMPSSLCFARTSRGGSSRGIRQLGLLDFLAIR